MIRNRYYIDANIVDRSAIHRLITAEYRGINSYSFYFYPIDNIDVLKSYRILDNIWDYIITRL